MRGAEQVSVLRIARTPVSYAVVVPDILNSIQDDDRSWKPAEPSTTAFVKK